MARLIDADALAKKAYDVAYPIIHGRNDHERGLTLFGMAQLLDDMPTVEAVPIEWIENIIAEIGDDSPYRSAIKWLLLTYKMEREE